MGDAAPGERMVEGTAEGPLAGRTAIVTGGSRGIGRAIAAAFVGAGAGVMITGRKESSLREAADALGSSVRWASGSVRHPEVAESTIAATLEAFGSVDILVNNAAVNPYYGPLMDIDADQMAVTAAANQAAIVFWTQSCWRGWMRDHGGVVINIASVGGLMAEPGLGYYNTTKAALMHLTRQLAVELAPSVRVNAIAPGLVRTDMARVLWEGRDEEELRSSTPLEMIGEPEDIGAAALFLASDLGRWITGTVLVVDGGMSIPR
jgi:NAD(P)-dependent dehydrogenase (short-subunit alcohol dehydrogenase family)